MKHFCKDAKHPKPHREPPANAKRQSSPLEAQWSHGRNSRTRHTRGRARVAAVERRSAATARGRGGLGVPDAGAAPTDMGDGGAIHLISAGAQGARPRRGSASRTMGAVKILDGPALRPAQSHTARCHRARPRGCGSVSPPASPHGPKRRTRGDITAVGERDDLSHLLPLLSCRAPGLHRPSGMGGTVGLPPMPTHDNASATRAPTP